jgi:hypothetical protein
MLASTRFKIRSTSKDDWFDTILDHDTKLFLDPFLLFKENKGFWSDSHNLIIDHFNRAFVLIAQGNQNPNSLAYKKAIDLLIFKEPKELCLGYTAHGSDGAGSALGYAKMIAAAISQAISRGITHPKHFEELGILNEGIGADRISDITATILKSKLVQYTQDISRCHGLNTDKHLLYAATFDPQRQRWLTSEVSVPTNPVTGRPILFVPARFLRDLPTLNADDWFDDYQNERLRTDVNYEIMTKVDKATIVAIARQNPEMVRDWTEKKETEVGQAYNFSSDPNGVWSWDPETAKYVASHPLRLQPPANDTEFERIIECVLDQFRLFIEDQGGWSLLWKIAGIQDKPEEAAQLLFRGIAQNYCRANNISLDAEVNLGNGAVDFKFSNGYVRRAHLEIKKVHNGKFWNGLEQQLPSYLKSDQVCDGWFVAIAYRDNKQTKARIGELPNMVIAVSKARNINLRYRIIDARPKLSASRL